MTDAPLSEAAKFTTITNADLIAWKKHARLLRVARMVFAAAATTNPCRCDDCSHCQELVQVGVEIEAVSIHASLRQGWLERRARSTAE